MALLGQASGGWTESSSALRILNLGISNTVGELHDDAFTQTNPPKVTTAGTISSKVDITLVGVLSGSVAFARGVGVAAGRMFVGGPEAAGTVLCRPLGVFINSANGNAFENTPAVSSGVGPYVSGMGTYGNSLYETEVLFADANVGIAGIDLTYLPGHNLFASKNGYLTHFHGAATPASQCAEGAAPTVIAVLKMAPDATQGTELIYDQRI